MPPIVFFADGYTKSLKSLLLISGYMQLLAEGVSVLSHVHGTLASVHEEINVPLTVLFFLCFLFFKKTYMVQEQYMVTSLTLISKK